MNPEVYRPNGNWAPHGQDVVHLPEQKGDTSSTYWGEVLQATGLLENAAKGKTEQRIELTLPAVVGYIPETERTEFDNTPSSSNYDEEGDDKYFMFDEDPAPKNADKPKLLPGLRKIIESDLAALGLRSMFEQPSEDTLLVKNTYVEAGQMPDRSLRSDWHVDHAPSGSVDGNTVRAHVTPLGYIVTNNFPTWLFSGLANVNLRNYDGLVRAEVALDEIDVRNNTVARPESYAVVRLGPLCVHSRPIVPQDTQRTFMRVALYPTAEGTRPYQDRLREAIK